MRWSFTKIFSWSVVSSAIEISLASTAMANVSYALLADTSTFEFSRTAADEIADFPVGLSAPECLFEEVARLRSLPVPRAFVDRGHQLQDLAQGWQLF